MDYPHNGYVGSPYHRDFYSPLPTQPNVKKNVNKAYHDVLQNIMRKIHHELSSRKIFLEQWKINACTLDSFHQRCYNVFQERFVSIWNFFVRQVQYIDQHNIQEKNKILKSLCFACEKHNRETVDVFRHLFASYRQRQRNS